MTDPITAIPWDGTDPAHLMQIEAIAPDRYANPVSRLRDDHHLFGGQVMAHALGAAALSAPGREVHSLHGYFLRPGDGHHCVTFEVERTRDGRTFSARRVVARQGDSAILHMECSFRDPGQSGLEHQIAMAPDIPMPEQLETLAEYAQRTGAPGASAASRAIGHSLIDIKPVDPTWLDALQPEPSQRIWLRIKDAEGVTDPLVRTQLLTYMSDFWLAGTGMAVHDPALRHTRLRIASIDHALWFHNPAPVDGWLLYISDSPVACRSTSLSRGSLYSRDGVLLASSAQESLFRIVAPLD